MRGTDKKALVILLGIVLLAFIGIFVVVFLWKDVGVAEVVKFTDLRKFINNVPKAGTDISHLDLRAQANAGEVLPFVQFNLNTVWPPKDKMPVGFDPLKVLEAAKNPGLGIEDLHKLGITGKGIGIGIMDLPIFTKNIEFKDRIKLYKPFGDTGIKAAANSCALVSALVGKSMGVAPEADVYYAAVAAEKLDVLCYSNAMDWFIELNNTLPKEKKIRIVVVPVAPDNVGEGDFDTPFKTNTEMWKIALKKAADAGIVVFDLTKRKAVGSCWIDINNLNDFNAVQTGYPDKPDTDVLQNYVLMPTCPKTVAEEYIVGQTGYRYLPRTGAPFIVSFAAGLAALGCQAAGYEKTSNMTISSFNELFFKTAFVKKNGLKTNYIVNPKAFIEAIKK